MESFVQYRKGRTPARIHADLDGLKDDELGRNGFFGRQAQLYRRWAPAATRSQGVLKERHIQTTGLDAADLTDPRGQPLLLLSNSDCRIFVSRRSLPMPFWTAHIDGDTVFFTHRGTGRIETEFGPLHYSPGDYVYIPKATVFRVVPDESDTLMLVIESVEELRIPETSVLGRHYPYDSTMVRIPEPEAMDDDGRDEYEVLLCHGDGQKTSLFYEHHPLDVEGWRGDNFPFALNIADYNVITSDSVHLPPSVHAFLKNDAVWILNFLPRPAESVPGTERTPWYHRNVDFDEVAFYHGGSVFGVDMPAGLLSHAPQGIHHGAPERARERARRLHDEMDRVEWEVINIDTRRRLSPSPAVLALEALESGVAETSAHTPAGPVR